ncbi:hypothetical protein SAMN04487886_101232 [Clostridium sp. DSM 8431]|uniref:hypothetical protein n=1 Tax=Clostridium sp. DSM 8431 TaxID=1761781 RepID=UPI0008DFBED0|nr:hypothetical protein [Clostridium sp. DSM 8431]SFU36340.1 hypothetical protein SAMN04487886_101232 [Clostridium sp. DSM 8431]
MKYIGSFFRMNSLSSSDIEGQLFYLSREAIKTIVLNSRCGILYSHRSSKKNSHHNDNLSILDKFSPLICLYRKSSPAFIHSKNSKSFDAASFKKDINPTTNALMTMSLLELANYYSNYSRENRNIDSLKDAYNTLAKAQLDFYYENLRNSEGVFIEKKNISDNDSKSFNLISKDKKFNFLDQAFMMCAYYLYYKNNSTEDSSEEYREFSLEILAMFSDFKEALYDTSFDDACKILFSFNVFYNYSKEEKAKSIIIDFSDFLMNKFEDKDYYTDDLESCALLAITLSDSYKNTDIISFKDKSDEIYARLENLYDDLKGIFLKLTDKKEFKYPSTEICIYFLALLLHSKESDNVFEYKNMLSTLYRKYFISSGLILSWPDPPTLDESERYRGLSLHSDDMLDESYFRMPNLPSPESSGMASVFAKNITYSRKKDKFSKIKETFESDKNIFIFFNFIYYFIDDISKEMNFSNAQENKSLEVSKKEEPLEEKSPSNCNEYDKTNQ